MAHPDTTRRALRLLAGGSLIAAAASCTGSATLSGHLVINEVMTDNDSAWLDEAGQVEDWIELANDSTRALELSNYRLRDARGRLYDLPDGTLLGGGLVVLFADGEPEQGPLHIGWKLSAAGTTLELLTRDDSRVVDRVEVPALAVNETYARLPSGAGESEFRVCRYATPEHANGAVCGPPPQPELPDRAWPLFDWSRAPAFRNAPKPLALNELALRPASFVEVVNLGAAPVDLRGYRLQVDTMAPGEPWPVLNPERALDWGTDDAAATLAPSLHRAVQLPSDAISWLEQDPAFEGVVTLFDAQGTAVDRVDFMRWPVGAVLTRAEGALHSYRFCQEASEGRANDACSELPARDVGDRVRHLYTPGDYDALAQGDTSVGMRGVKFVVDMNAGDAVHLLSTRAWPLHYTFVREQIDHEPPLDRCDAAQAASFQQGWYAFSEREYFREQGRRYLLGTLDSYAGTGLRAFDFAVGDQISAAQMQHAFFRVVGHLDAEAPEAWAVHPSEPRQEQALAQISGRLPVVARSAPFRNLQLQPLTEGIAFGRLRYVAAGELERAVLGPDVIVITEAVPNDIPFVGGLITEEFQTPLAHVNVLSQNRGTPNLGLLDARNDSRVAPLVDHLVRFEVSNAGFSLREASDEEAAVFLASRAPYGPRVQPRSDLSVRGPLDLATRGLESLPIVGAKAAQLAELARVVASGALCAGQLPLPEAPFAIPLGDYAEHFERSGARAMLVEAASTAAFQSDSLARAAVLERMRKAILETPVDPQLLGQVEALIGERFGGTRLRFRSSSNTEDLPGFNGAGLYESWSAALGDDERPIPAAMRAVWASLWTQRAYDEREFGHIEQAGVAMAILVHPAFLSERANVIVISRDVLDPARSDIHYMNAQAGEASVANPAPGVSSEVLLHHYRVIPGTPEVEYQSRSSLTHGRQVLSVADAQRISCYAAAIHEYFQRLLDPSAADRWFAMDMEVKLVGAARAVVIKQARPYRFGQNDRPTDCREF